MCCSHLTLTVEREQRLRGVSRCRMEEDPDLFIYTLVDRRPSPLLAASCLSPDVLIPVSSVRASLVSIWFPLFLSRRWVPAAVDCKLK